MPIVSDGDEAIAYLSKQGQYADTERFVVPQLWVFST